MPAIYDNIDAALLLSLRGAFEVAFRADFCVGYFNLRGWRAIDQFIDEWPGTDDGCCRLLVGMQAATGETLRKARRLEFKDSLRWDESPAKLGERYCYKTVAAFLNSDGGDLLIGVHDSGSISGLAADYARDKKRPDSDGFLQYLTQLLISAVGNPMLARIRISMHRVDGQDVCRVHTQPADEPAWVNEGGIDKLFVRSGNATRELVGREATAYAFAHWKTAT